MKATSSHANHRAKAVNTCSRQDEQLVSAAQAGCESAFAQLQDLYSQRIYRTIFSITKNREDAEDALQEALLKAYLGLKNFEGRANFSSWLTRIAINSSLMILRRKRTRPEQSFSAASDTEEDFAPFELRDAAPNPEQCYDHKQRQARLLKAIQKLAPPLREMVQIRMVEEHSLKNSARALNISEAAAKSRLYRARTRLATSHSLNALAGIRTSERRRVGKDSLSAHRTVEHRSLRDRGLELAPTSGD